MSIAYKNNKYTPLPKRSRLIFLLDEIRSDILTEVNKSISARRYTEIESKIILLRRHLEKLPIE